MVQKAWTLGTPWARIDLELAERPDKTDGAARAEARRVLTRVAYDFRCGDFDARRVVLEICAQLGVSSLPELRRRAQAIDVGSANWTPFMAVLARATETGVLIARQRETRAVMVPLDGPSEDVLGPALDGEVEPDVYVLAAEVKLIGDTPLIRHAVRVLDPDTGEVVADGLMTDADGIVRTDVPAKKIYRIEIVDRDPDLDIVPTVAQKHPVLRCAFVDPAGNPVPDLDVRVKDIDGVAVDYTSDEDGLLEVPSLLGLYEVVIGDDSHWVHSLLHRDDDDAYEIVVRATLEDGGDGLDPDDRLSRSWADDGDGDDDDDDSDAGGVAADGGSS